MSTRTQKIPKTKRLSSGVTTASFDPGHFFEFTSTGMPTFSPLPENSHKKPANGKGASKKKVCVSDRRYLKDIEIFLNNCVNLAARLEDKRGAKVLQLLREARELAIHVRG